MEEEPALAFVNGSRWHPAQPRDADIYVKVGILSNTRQYNPIKISPATFRDAFVFSLDDLPAY